jgi:hypothetical protein
MCRPQEQLLLVAAEPVAHHTTGPRQLSKQLGQAAAATLLLLLLLQLLQLLPLLLLQLLPLLLLLLRLRRLLLLLHGLHCHLYRPIKELDMKMVEDSTCVHQRHHVLQAALWGSQKARAGSF